MPEKSIAAEVKVEGRWCCSKARGTQLKWGAFTRTLKAGAIGGRHAPRGRGKSDPTELLLNQTLSSYCCNTLGFHRLTEELELAGYSAGSSVKVSN